MCSKIRSRSSSDKEVKDVRLERQLQLGAEMVNNIQRVGNGHRECKAKDIVHKLNDATIAHLLLVLPSAACAWTLRVDVCAICLQIVMLLVMPSIHSRRIPSNTIPPIP